MNTWWWLALIAVLLLGAIASVVDGRARSPRRPGGRTRPPGRPGRTGPRAPRPGEIWWAMVPFEDGPGSKDRPCLVLSVRGRSAQVAKITTKGHTERPGVIALPPGMVQDAQGRASFLEMDELRDVRLKDFRRRAGEADGELWKRIQRLAG
ncbi:hypothetical protein HY68_15740 [Streptomyces sp. AcH 505]|uniref:type II toxin-antitoxin system PemK/MazF family toxin n=1 Tax=unclassified Streptomyces TaxID=2593676 RepID=UPI000591A0CE|nr:type II toxin-antitoxin system PemK/MazF family toxin [Streptomyces sp. NBC_00370]KIF72199.1 hypothetical protein HY68_15740 [Streptomyces sp. AcH 505]